MTLLEFTRQKPKYFQNQSIADIMGTKHLITPSKLEKNTFISFLDQRGSDFFSGSFLCTLGLRQCSKM